ncbi:MAG TPA: lipid A deacylase LpxR family protein [Alphaproteobacteria bacterium]|nr:lipid A deacylase LpxR family protein [Alphaproteobacteria bacterium]
MKRVFPFLLATIFAVSFAQAGARADDNVAGAASAVSPGAGDNDARWMLTEENDKFASPDDRHYTQGIRLSRFSAPLAAGSTWDEPFIWLSANAPIFEDGNFKREYDWAIIGQSMFTPQNTQAQIPPSTDRPYGAWLYTGVSLLQETRHATHDTLENAELLAGIVGPAALGGPAQNDWHQFIGVNSAQGWTNQLHNEPGLAATYERKWRFEKPLGDYFSTDAIPELGATGGNVFTYAEAGGQLRFGHDLEADYGSSHIRPSLSGTGWFDPARMTGPLGWYLFVGAQGRAVARNIFLDGNTFVDSPSVHKRILVADFVAGASVFWRDDVRLDFTVVQRTPEFYGQQGTPDRFGSVGLVVGF